MAQRYAMPIAVLVLLACLGGPANGEQVTMAGRVVGPDDQPLPDCEVMARYWGPDDKVAKERGLSDATGAFSLDLGVMKGRYRISLLARKAGLALDWQVVEAPAEVTLKLGAEPVTCAGTVSDPEGKPIEAATVFAQRLMRPDKEDPERQYGDQIWFGDERFISDNTDEAGRFGLADLPPDQSLTLVAVAEGRERVRLEEPVPTGARDLEIVLRPEVIISGRVTREGEPVAGIRVSARPVGPGRGDSRVTDEQGNYRLSHLSPGAWYVLFDPPEGLTAKAVGPVALNPGEHFAEGHAELTPGGLVTGTVTEERTGGPVPGALITAHGPSRPADAHPGERAVTDEQGKYQLRLAPGRNTIRYRGILPDFPWDQTRPTPGEHTVQVSEGEAMQRVDFVVRTKASLVVRGQVVDREGRPMAGVKIGSPHGTGPIGSSFQEQFTAETDAEGNFELHLNRIGEHDGWPVLAMEPERGLAGIRLMPADKLPEEPVQITVSEGGYVTATILDTGGKPVPQVPTHVSIFPHGRGIGYGMNGGPTDENGRITIGPLPVGPTVYVQPGGKFHNLVVEPTREKAFISPGGEHELAPIVLNLAGRSLVGWVTDEKPQPIKGAMVCVSGQDEPVRTDETGKFELTGLAAAGKVWIVAMHPTKPLVAAENVDPDWDIEPSLILRPTGSAEGRILNEEGEPIAGAKVRGYPQFPITSDAGAMFRIHPWERDLQRRVGQRDHFLRTVTDADGKWRVEGLIGGAQYRFSIELPDGTSAWQSYEFIAEPDATTDAGEVTATPPPE